ncbi:hypothetical protein ACFLZ7_03140 [Nanoarchaeota archaeon]
MTPNKTLCMTLAALLGTSGGFAGMKEVKEHYAKAKTHEAADNYDKASEAYQNALDELPEGKRYNKAREDLKIRVADTKMKAKSRAEEEVIIKENSKLKTTVKYVAPALAAGGLAASFFMGSDDALLEQDIEDLGGINQETNDALNARRDEFLKKQKLQNVVRYGSLGLGVLLVMDKFVGPHWLYDENSGLQLSTNPERMEVAYKFGF